MGTTRVARTVVLLSMLAIFDRYSRSETGVAYVSEPKIQRARAMEKTNRGRLDGPWYRAEPDAGDDEWRRIGSRHRLLCKASRGNFWLCQDNHLALGDTSVTPEPTVSCEDCNGHIVPRLRAAELGNQTWN
jgi:hypothetical protein